MSSRLSDEERAVWSDLYTLHERFHDRDWNDRDWRELAEALENTSRTHENSPLVINLCIGLMCFFEAVWRARQAEIRETPVQLEMVLR